jgi:hypothetical protein
MICPHLSNVQQDLVCTQESESPEMFVPDALTQKFYCCSQNFSECARYGLSPIQEEMMRVFG